MLQIQEPTFRKFIDSVQNQNHHPTLNLASLSPLHNLIFYGPASAGKYSQVLWFLKDYSPSKLSRRSKLHIQVADKIVHTIVYSDIHFEIDLALLGCHQKIWYDMYCQIVEMVSARNSHCFGNSTSMLSPNHVVIVCRNFHQIHNELLEVFYSYMRQYHVGGKGKVEFSFILLTEHYSFIPNEILHASVLVSVPRPTWIPYNALYLPTLQSNCESIWSVIQSDAKVVVWFQSLREKLYDFLVFNLSESELCWWFIQRSWRIAVSKEKMVNIGVDFLHGFVNKYRPIFHLEKFCIALKKNVLL